MADMKQAAKWSNRWAQRANELEARVRKLEAENEILRERGDQEGLDWLAKNEANLVTHREKMQDEGAYTIWWNVVKRGRSISGHPLGSPRAAINAAMFVARPKNRVAE